MHLLVRETHTLDEREAAVDLRQTPAPLVILSFSDSDLGALASAWQGMGPARPGLRLANLARLRHPMSVDLYVEDIVSHARCVVIRLLGGLEYWRYGAEEVAACCKRAGIALALVPGDGRVDPALTALSTMPARLLTRMDHLLAEGGPVNMRAALALAAHAGGLGPEEDWTPEPVAQSGMYPVAGNPPGKAGLAAIVFYRAWLLAGDMAPVDSMITALQARGLAVHAIFVASLKEPGCARFVADRLAALKPSVVLNATGFSARVEPHGSPLDAAGAPVLQLLLSGSTRQAWLAGSRGVSPTDLAMQVVMPELDGRLSTAAISFKESEPAIDGLEFSRYVHRPDAGGIASAADRAAGWARLACAPRADRRIAIVLSNYPGAPGQFAHAVGLDSFASLAAILRILGEAGYGTAAVGDLVRGLTIDAATPMLSVAAYQDLLPTLAEAARVALHAAWGAPASDPCVEDGAFTLRFMQVGNATLVIEPERGCRRDRREGYHDADLPPRHGYVAFHLWLRHQLDVHAIVHLGAHGALEWLPGKANALSAACFPLALARGLPVIYPFIVNNPGEAAAAKRRLGAVTIGHMTPPLREAGLHGEAAELERLIDEFAGADGLDRRRADLLRQSILDLAESCGLLAESGSDRLEQETALARLDAYLCDVKEMQIRDGLHVFGVSASPELYGRLLAALIRACPATAPAELADRLDRSARCERDALLAALDGRFVPPGPAGAPSRGRADVLPTGRNMSTSDPRSMPTRSALRLASLAASDLLRRHRQDHGEWPRAVVIDLWGSATLRTGGEDLALALILMGAAPTWDADSNRVTGVDILPLALLDRPRVDVTLRVSGLFRDAFEAQIALFDSAVRAIAVRDEAVAWNPLVLAPHAARVFGPAPGAYGAGEVDPLRETAADRGQAYLDASATAYDRQAAPEAFASRILHADAFIHLQDHRELDLLEGSEHAAHEGGFAAAAALLGATPALYHADTSQPDRPRTATIAEEIVRVVRGRAANPVWLAGMMRHGYRGGAEIARSLEGLLAFAATLPDRFDPQFDLFYDATLGNPKVDAFLADANPQARQDMHDRFQAARERGLWRPRRNDIPQHAVLGSQTQ